MWADTLLSAERVHLLRLLVWGALSVSAQVAIVWQNCAPILFGNPPTVRVGTTLKSLSTG